MGDTNSKLIELYKEYIDKIDIEELISQKFSNPLMVKSKETYEKAKIKILFIGRETFSWDYRKHKDSNFHSNNEIEDIRSYSNTEEYIKKYQEMYDEYMEGEKSDGSPFHKFMKEIKEKIGGDCDYMWTNVFRCDQDRSMVKRKRNIKCMK